MGEDLISIWRETIYYEPPSILDNFDLWFRIVRLKVESQREQRKRQPAPGEKE